MRVSVRLLGSLRPINTHGSKEVELDANSDLMTLVKYLSDEYPEVAGLLKISGGILFMLDGVEMENLRGLATLLRDGSEVVLIPVTHGG